MCSYDPGGGISYLSLIWSVILWRGTLSHIIFCSPAREPTKKEKDRNREGHRPFLEVISRHLFPWKPTNRLMAYRRLVVSFHGMSTNFQVALCLSFPDYTAAAVGGYEKTYQNGTSDSEMVPGLTVLDGS